MLRILATGDFDPMYNRTKVILDGLADTNSVAIEILPYNRKALDKNLLRRAIENADAIFIPAFCHADVAIIKKLTAKPILFDPLISRYQTKVFDYKLVGRYSPRALKNFLKDKSAMQKAHIVFADTAAHAAYFMDKFGVPKSKLVVLPVGVNTAEFHPRESAKTTERFNIGFYGSFNPLQGIEKIVEAASLLKDHAQLQFNIIGSGFDELKVKQRMEELDTTNIILHGQLPYNRLPAAINGFDLALGIFGNTPKAGLVIPNKIYHYAAMRKCIITLETPAIKEVFTGQENILFTDTSAQSLADTILQAYEHDALREKIASAGYKLITENYNHHKIAAIVVDAARKIIA